MACPGLPYAGIGVAGQPVHRPRRGRRVPGGQGANGGAARRGLGVAWRQAGRRPPGFPQA